MSVDERARHRLYDRAVEVLGEEEAATLMAHLPPGGYPNLATKQDLLELEQRLSDKVEASEVRLGARINSSEQRVKAHTWKVVLSTIIPTMAIMSGIAFGAAKLT